MSEGTTLRTQIIADKNYCDINYCGYCLKSQ